MRHSWLFCLSLVALAGCEATPRDSAPATAPKAVYACQYTELPPIIDGRLDEAAWKRATVLTLTHVLGQTPTQPQDTRVRILWDDACLYFGAELKDRDVVASFQERDKPVWDEDCLEIFLDASGNGSLYAEIDVGPKGALWDGLVVWRDHRRLVFPDWNPTSLKVKTQRQPDGWTLEGRIRFQVFGSAFRRPPFPNDAWRMNLFRCDHATAAHAGSILTAWSPTESFHAPQNFGTLVFSHPARLKRLRVCKDAARAFLASRAYEKQASLAELLPQLQVSSPGTTYRYDATQQAWRAKERWGSLGRADKEVLPGLLYAHPHSAQAPITVRWRARHKGELIVIAKLSPNGSRRVQSGHADGVVVRLTQGQQGKVMQSLRIVDDEWQLMRLMVPKNAAMALSVDAGPAENLSSDKTIFGVYTVSE